MYKLFLFSFVCIVSFCILPVSVFSTSYTSSKSIIDFALPISLRQRIYTAIETNRIYTGYTAHITPAWKLVFWHRSNYEENTTEWTSIVGGGIESPLFVLGNYYEQGLYSLFSDISDTRAWDSSTYHHTRWRIRIDPIESPDFGAMITIPQYPFSSKRAVSNTHLLSIWTGYSPQESVTHSLEEVDNTYSNYGFSMGMPIGFWEPRILYKYSYRESLPIDKTNWESWILIEPSALRVHQIQIAQRFVFPNNFLSEVVGIVTKSDIHTKMYSGKAMLRFFLNRYELGFHISFADSYTVTDEWKYTKYRWSGSTELLVHYYTHAHIKFRAEISEYNTREEYVPYPQVLRRGYFLDWKHSFDIGEDMWTLIPKLSYTYMYTQDEEYHRGQSEIGVDYAMFFPLSPHTRQEIGRASHNITQSIDWNIDELSREVKDIISASSLKSQFSFYPINLTLWTKIRIDYNFDVLEYYVNSADEWYMSLEELSISTGIHYRIHGLYISSAIVYILDEVPYSQEKKFEHEWELELKIQYNW